eukprot:scaffold2351_cov66-Phaeocystis_antarctica.AAC.1
MTRRCALYFPFPVREPGWGPGPRWQGGRATRAAASPFSLVYSRIPRVAQLAVYAVCVGDLNNTSTQREE